MGGHAILGVRFRNPGLPRDGSARRNGRQVIFPFSAHTIPSNEETAACAYEVMNDFLDDPGGAPDTSCVARLPPIEYSTEPP